MLNRDDLTILESADLIRPLRDSEYAYLFKHILTQETAYSSLLRQDRRQLHRRIAAIYETLFAGQLDDYLSLLAFHYGEAGDVTKAVEYLSRYGERAMQISAFPEAIR